MKIVHKKAICRSTLINNIHTIQDHKEKIDESFDAMETLFGDLTGGDLYESVYKLFDSFIDSMCISHGININWLTWFIYDNEFGDEGLDCNLNGKLYTIDDIDSFADFLIEESNSVVK